jgi:hypothetical protein
MTKDEPNNTQQRQGGNTPENSHLEPLAGCNRRSRSERLGESPAKSYSNFTLQRIALLAGDLELIFLRLENVRQNMC